MKRSYFITGTDTGVGKTFVAATIARAFIAKGLSVGVMKPVETGCRMGGGGLVPEDALRLKDASGSTDPIDLINPYRFPEPVSPLTASRLNRTTIGLERIKASYDSVLSAHDITLVEGAGGLLTPVTDGSTMADLALYLGAPVIIVAANRLGAINHTLLTVSVALSKGLKVSGIVLNNAAIDDSDVSRRYNREEIEGLSGVPILAELPFIKGKKEAPNLPEGGLSKILSALI